MLNDKELKEIAITDASTGEVIAYISDGNVIQNPNVLVRLNYGNEYKFKDVDGKIYIEGDENEKK
jgi:hypothetical protein